MTKALAEMLFGSEEALIQIDMSEFMERHTISRLARPCYVGYEEAAFRPGLLRRKPYSIVVFDEAEKAHPEAYCCCKSWKKGNSLRRERPQGRLPQRYHHHDVQYRRGPDKAPVLARFLAGSGQRSGRTVQLCRDEKEIDGSAQRNLRPEFVNRLDSRRSSGRSTARISARLSA